MELFEALVLWQFKKYSNFIDILAKTGPIKQETPWCNWHYLSYKSFDWLNCKKDKSDKLLCTFSSHFNGNLQINIMFVKIISYPTGQIDQTCSCWLQLNCLTKRYTHESQFLERLIKINRSFGYRFNFFAKWFEGIFELVPQFTFSLKKNNK